MRQLSVYSTLALLISAWSGGLCFAGDTKSGSGKVSQEVLRDVFRGYEGKEALTVETAPGPLKPKDEKIRRLTIQQALTRRDRPVPPTVMELEALAESTPLAAPQLDSRITLHTAASLDLKVGAERGIITYPLYRGMIESTNAIGYFVLADASDAAFAKEFGVMYSPNLAAAYSGAWEEAEISADGAWRFPSDPGLVARGDGGAVRGVLANPVYSPLKRISWEGREVIVNAPLVKWGDAPGQQMLVDHGGCDPLIRRNPPTGEFRGGGPPGCETDPPENALARYRGGQALGINFLAMCDNPPSDCGSITMKLHRAVYREGIYPYVTVFGASKAATAEELGIPYVPRLASLGPSGASNAVASIIEFQNGLYVPDGGPARFQPGVTTYGSQMWSTYSPFLHVTWGFFDCDDDGRFVDITRNVSYAGGLHEQKAGMANVDPSDPSTFQPFAMVESGKNCPDYVAYSVGRRLAVFPKGTVLREDIPYVADQGALFITEAPPGWSGEPLDAPALRGLDSPDLRTVLIINAPSPVTIEGQ